MTQCFGPEQPRLMGIARLFLPLLTLLMRTDSRGSAIQAEAWLVYNSRHERID
jgi:hypothetical protein